MDEYTIWLASVSIPNEIKIKLATEYKTPANLWYQTIHKNNFLSYNSKIRDKMVSAWNKDEISKLLSRIKDAGIKYVSYEDDNYPEKLKYINNPPYVLFYYGDILQLDKGHNVALVGSRRCTPYGIDSTKFITKDLCANNINIISGMAKGIDSTAHWCALDNGGFTCAVLGCGIDIVYPKENIKLYSRLIKNGCIISEFIPGTQPYHYNFPMRNRIISGLSDVVIIVEAGEKSGSLITAGTALDQGKDVIAVPGSIFSEASKGTNKLIKDGAYPFIGMEDIYNLIGIEYKKNSSISGGKFNEDERSVYSILTDSPIHIDDILKITDIDINRLYELLFEMQLRDEIMCLAGNYYVKMNYNTNNA